MFDYMGTNDNEKIANFVETEQMLILKSSNVMFKKSHCSIIGSRILKQINDDVGLCE